MNPYILTIVGLSLDMLGAILVAIEVVSQFRGEKFEAPPLQFGGTSKPVPTKNFKQWDNKRLFWMKLGLIALTCGFLLQISANYSQYRDSKTNYCSCGNNTKPSTDSVK
jgi:hypothetical protein